MNNMVKIPCFEGINKMVISEEEKMLVKIVKCENDGARYSSMVGETIEVSYFPADRLAWSIPAEDFSGYILIDDTDLCDGKRYTTEEVINYRDWNNKRRTYFINLNYNGNQAAIVSYNERTGMFEDFSRKKIRSFSPLDLFARSLNNDSYGRGEDTTYSCSHYDTWTRLTRDFFSFKIK